ncbi:MAG: DinB family protein [Chloroflexi bacterium]|nr:DinB family protein [Chloroflexota bacterium]
MDRTEITAHLRQLPDLIEEVLHGLSDDELRRRPTPDEWSALEVCCHLRDYAQEEGVRVRRLVEEDEPALEAYDAEAWARERNYQGDDPARVRTALRAFWGGLAYQLEGLSDQQWERGGTHSERGAITVRSRAEQQVDHARAHLEQLSAIRKQM